MLKGLYKALSENMRTDLFVFGPDLGFASRSFPYQLIRMSLMPLNSKFKCLMPLDPIFRYILNLYRAFPQSFLDELAEKLEN